MSICCSTSSSICSVSAWSQDQTLWFSTWTDLMSVICAAQCLTVCVCVRAVRGQTCQKNSWVLTVHLKPHVAFTTRLYCWNTHRTGHGKYTKQYNSTACISTTSNTSAKSYDSPNTTTKTTANTNTPNACAPSVSTKSTAKTKRHITVKILLVLLLK